MATLSFTPTDSVCQGFSPGSPSISISLPLCLTTSSRGPYHNHQCPQKAVTAAGGWQSLCGSPPSLPGSMASHSCNIFWEWMKIGATDSFDLDFFPPAQRQQLHHQWISQKIKNIYNSQPRNDRVQTQIFWVLKVKILDLEKEKNEKTIKPKIWTPISRVCFPPEDFNFYFQK